MLKIKNVIFVCLIAILYGGVAQAGGAGWTTSMKEAIAESKKTGKPILADFTGSDWCGWCIKLNNEVFSKSQFKNWAKKNVVLLELDYPSRKQQSAAVKKQNNALKNKYKIRGYPTILLLGADGKVLQKTGYGRGGPQAWIGNIKKTVKTYQTAHPSSKSKGSDSKVVAYPEIIKKNLHAKNDFRGKKAPSFEFGHWLTDQPNLTSEKQVILVDFWATWCGPCVRLIPEMNHFKKQFGKDLQVIGLSDETTEKVLGFMQKTKVDYAMAVDSEARMKKELGVSGIPHVMLISSDGIVRWQGFPGSTEDKLTADVIKQVIAADQAANGWGKGAKKTKKKRVMNVSAKAKAVNTHCLVSGAELEEGKGAKAMYAGKIYGMCCKKCLAKFKASPDKILAAIK